ncbi:glycosyltransferase family 2 protein [Thioalkalivibrio sp. XN279]|uniref:glycosyltransferase family 2 protein n=1 Tax=Thioalkalivibrio sp. XN279 TaxID=2714953 RepID=UPI00140A36F9|nr:glycosyltransferase family 2 protein [Thioalkalivibrio sp. XN279]NHA16048.1 glycosyltransferase family 2 protein [Thioalkalivibrio sp. XN279]
MMHLKAVSVVIPAKNEGETIGGVVQRLKRALPDVQILVVDDGSTDETRQKAEQVGAEVVRNPYSLGNGGAIKTGARAASGEILVFMDADGQHDAEQIPRLLEEIDAGYDMAVGARTHASQASHGRKWANRFYNRLASYMTGQPIPDLTSGLRAVRASKFREFLYLLPNGFSYPTTITMAFFRAGYPVAYVPFTAGRREGRSHINPLKDGLRFLLIIFKIGTLYSPLKLFVPIALLHGALGLSYYAYTYTTASRLSVATVFMLTAAVTIFLIGLVSEQITALMYKDSGDKRTGP